MMAKPKSTTAQPSTFTFFSEYDSTDFQLDSAVAERIREAKKVKKVAFLSGVHRTYYPEKPGHSKFAQVYSPHGDPTLPPGKFYKPPDTDRLNKPVSKKCYGIGGMSGQRFSVDNKESFPGPGHYHKEDKGTIGQQKKFPPQVWMNYGLIKREDGKRLLSQQLDQNLTGIWNKCQQVKAPFGSSLKQPRFGKDRKYNVVGPGHYVVKEYNPPKLAVNNGFLRGPVKFDTSTKLHCSYGAKDGCVQCGRTLMSSLDYYRSKRRIALVPLPDSSTSTVHFFRNSEDLTPAKPLEHEDDEDQRMRHVLLCRECYCKAMRGESKYWKKAKDVQLLFEKTRHCSYIHEHNGLPQYIEKVSCYWARRLNNREATLSLHWPDKCPKRVLERK